ncbi:uncharacterized protein LOC126897795 [Daktulosphaira vitifoliae]|uniref:uncharacterized protein LOC126897795 n=1 Tax=Daktulosphaira vitifoliae TaxID=58002 RepID=UPI0021AA4050|nr:uncharacterized protein LOC126897795 [Daktulosphaira vitifoliae]
MDSNTLMIDDDDGQPSMMMSTPPPPPSFHGEAPLAQPDDDLRTPGGLDDTTGTGSTVSPVSPVHKNNSAKIDEPVSYDRDKDTIIIPLIDRNPMPPQTMEPTADDRDVPVVSMSSGGATGVPPISEQEQLKGTSGSADEQSDSKKEKEKKNKNKNKNKDESKKEKSKYSSSGTDGAAGIGDDGNSAAAQRYASGAVGCPATTEYILLTVLCSVLLIACTAGTAYWTIAFRDGYDTTPAAVSGGSSWFPWPPPSLKEILRVGVFTYQLHNASQSSSDQSFLPTTTAQQLNTQNPLEISLAERRFNLHPTMMVAGFVTVTGFSMLVYRMAAKCTGTGCRTTYLKLTHSLLHTVIGVPCVCIGALAAAQYHTSLRLPHLYSVHSWMGTLTYSLFFVQIILGLFTFVVLLCCRAATARCRLRCFAPIHATLGLCTFSMAIATCLTGLQQRADTKIYNSTNGNSLANSVNEKLHTTVEPVVVNCLAALLILTLIVVSYTVRRESLKRYQIGAGGPPLISTATVSPMRGTTGTSIKSSSSTRKLQPPV